MRSSAVVVRDEGDVVSLMQTCPAEFRTCPGTWRAAGKYGCVLYLWSLVDPSVRCEGHRWR
eukprot:4996508-Pyramimonas_sp.AAC.1